MTLEKLLEVLQEGAESPAARTAARLLIDRDDDDGATDAALLSFLLEPHEHPTATSMACRILAERDPNRDPSYALDWLSSTDGRGSRILAIVLPGKRILYKFPWTSMYGISRLRHTEPIRHYAELLQSRRTAARWNAAVALGDTADITALSALGIALSDRAWRVRRDAANSIRRLRHFGATTVWPSHGARDQLVARLDDPHNLVAIAAAQALWSLNDHEPVRSAAQSLPHRHQEFLSVTQGDIPILGPMWAADDHL